MKFWQSALLFPVSALAASAAYDLYRSLVRHGTASESRWESGGAAVPLSLIAPAKVVVLPLQSRIAVMELFGPITGGSRLSDYVNLLESLRGDRKVKAVVLEVDSPGGSATASEYLYRSVARLSAQKPVIVLIRGTGASGAYMVACGASKIIALPSSVVGSIGVIHINPVVKDLLKRLGIDMTVTKSGPYKDMGAFYREATKEEERKKEELVRHYFDLFVNLVASARKMPVEKVKEYATGEIYTGGQAKECGLVDELGDMDLALTLASKLGQVPRRVSYVRPRRPLLQRFMSRFTSSLVEDISAEMEQRLSPSIYYQYRID